MSTRKIRRLKLSFYILVESEEADNDQIELNLETVIVNALETDSITESTSAEILEHGLLIEEEGIEEEEDPEELERMEEEDEEG